MLFNLKTASQYLLSIKIVKSPKKGISDSYLQQNCLWYIPEGYRRRKMLRHDEEKVLPMCRHTAVE